jgi:hypothetical protein
MKTSALKNAGPADAEDQLQTSIATSNAKLNSNPYCRVSLLHCEDTCNEDTDSLADATCAIMRASTVRFNDRPMEVPPAMYFDCSKIRKLDKVFCRKVDDPVSDVQNDDCPVPEPSDPGETCSDGGEHTAQTPKPDDSPRRKYPKRNPSPLCTTVRAAKHVVIQSAAS